MQKHSLFETSFFFGIEIALFSLFSFFPPFTFYLLLLVFFKFGRARLVGREIHK